MKSLKGTKTAKNLMMAFAGESQATMRYKYYAKVANKEKYIQIRDIFEETARNEEQHAKRFYRFLQKDFFDEEIEVVQSFPVHLDEKEGPLSNLKAAAAGEEHEHSEMYPEFAKIAKEEGFDEVAEAFTEISEVEEAHEKRYRALIKNIEEDKVFKKDKKVLWHCLNCGYIHEGKEAPEVCPACLHPQGYFEVYCDEF